MVGTDVPPPAVELRELLQEANAKLACCTCGAATGAPANNVEPEALSALTGGGSQSGEFAAVPQLALKNSHVTPDSSFEGFVAESLIPNVGFSSPTSGYFLLPNNLRNIDSVPTPSISTVDASSFLADGVGSAILDILPSAWPSSLPPPVIVYHLVETFFTSVPLASRLIHKPTFMVNLRQVPTSPDFP